MRLPLAQSRRPLASSQPRLDETSPLDERRAHPGWVAALVVLTTIILVMSLESLAVALPAMMTSMRVGLQEMSWTMTGFLVSRTLFVGTAGWLGNRLGNRNLFALCLAVFLGGALGCGLAWRFEALVIFRILQGMGAGPLLPLIMVILHESFPPEQRGLAQSFYMIGDAAGAICGRGLAGYLIELLGWRSIFYINLPLGLIALVGLLIIVPNRRDEQAHSFDPLGLLFLSGFVACLLVGLQSGAQNGWEHTGVSVLLMLSGASFVAFLVTEYRVTEPLIDLSLFRHRAYSLVCLISAINMIGLIGAVIITPIMLQRLLNLTPIHAGLILVPGAIAWGVVGPISGKLGDRMDVRWLLMASFTLNIWALWQLASVTLEMPSTVLTWRATCMWGTMALSFTPLFLVCMRTVPTRSLRMATGMMNLMRGLASVAGIAIVSIALDHRQRYHFQALAQEQSQHTLEIAPILDRLYHLWLGQGDWSGLAAHKAMALLSGQLHTEAALRAYQECYLGFALLYVLLVFLVWGLHPRYTVPESAPTARE